MTGINNRDIGKIYTMCMHILNILIFVRNLLVHIT